MFKLTATFRHNGLRYVGTRETASHSEVAAAVRAPWQLLDDEARTALIDVVRLSDDTLTIDECLSACWDKTVLLNSEEDDDYVTFLSTSGLSPGSIWVLPGEQRTLETWGFKPSKLLLAL